VKKQESPIVGASSSSKSNTNKRKSSQCE
jgi:hypothetical protein